MAEAEHRIESHGMVITRKVSVPDCGPDQNEQAINLMRSLQELVNSSEPNTRDTNTSPSAQTQTAST